MAKRRKCGRPKKSVARVEDAEFFKVFIPNLSSHQLLIPPDFIKNFKKTIKEKVILKNIDGKTWYVDVKETPNGVFLQNGWQGFVDYHGLKVGEFLVFQYDKSYSYIVKIFGTNGCKKETLESKNIVTRVKSEEETDKEMTPEQTSRKRAAPQNEDHLLDGDGRTDHSERFGEVNEVQEEVRASGQPENSKEFENKEQVRPKCPFFVSPPSDARKVKLCIPAELIKKHNLHLEPEMILCNVKGKEWPVRTFTRADGPAFLGKGLFKFHKDNNVGSKDSCKFTFGTERSSRTINVQVLRPTPRISRNVRRR